MNLKEQQYIVTLAGCGSMTQAAKKLNITQPALSSYLAGVENSLGYPLFERTGKALRPTYLGELYLENVGTRCCRSSVPYKVSPGIP